MAQNAGPQPPNDNSPKTSVANGKGAIPSALGSTGIVVAAGGLSDPVWQDIAAYCGPTLTVLGTAAWNWSAPVLSEWFHLRWAERQNKKWQEDPEISDVDKKKLQNRVTQMRMAFLKRRQTTS